MACFEDAYRLLKLDEGGWVNNPRDPGAETFGGISRRFYPNWAGWARVDELRKANVSLAQLNSDPQLLAAQCDFFKKEYWLPIYYRINSQAIANKVFSLAVNMDPAESIKGEAHKLLQLACIDCGELVSADGAFGELTLNAANSADPVLLLQALKRQAVGHYQHLVALDQSKSCFLVGWCKRAMA